MDPDTDTSFEREVFPGFSIGGSLGEQLDSMLAASGEAPAESQVAFLGLLADPAALRTLGLRPADLIETAPIVHRAIDYYLSGAELGLPITTSTAIWQDVRPLYLASQTPVFQVQIQRLLADLGVSEGFRGLRLACLFNVLFHPLQNAREWGTERSGPFSRGFAGLLLRVVADPRGWSPGFPSWQSARADSGPVLEALIHDHGVGIAAKYGESRGMEEVESWAMPSEWGFLKAAFEKHVRSRRAMELLDSQGFQAGIGLPSMLAALKSLGGLLEIRTGRLLAYRSFQEKERLSASPLIKPDAPPEAPRPRWQGTLVRLLLPVGAA